MLSYKYRIYPDMKQVELLGKHLDVCRKLYNSFLEYSYAKREKYNETPTAFDLCYWIKPLREQVPELKQMNHMVLEDVATRVRSGFVNFWARRLRGLKAGLPHFKKAGDYDSLTYRQNGYKINGNTITLIKIGDIKINLHRPTEGKIKEITIMRDGLKWYAVFACVVENKAIEDRQQGSIVGVDFGLKSLIATNDGELIDPPKCYRNSERRLKRLGRQLSKKKLRSRNWYKAKSRLAKLHHKVANQRKDFTFNLSRKLVNRYETVILEDLKISNMQKNKHLSKSIGDAGWGGIKRCISYMAEMSGGKMILVNPYGTSQVCPKCGGEVHKTLADRIHNCPHCGLVVDRDVASAMEIKNRGQIILERDRVAQTQIHACGDDGNVDLEQSGQRPASMNQEQLTSNREDLYKAPNEELIFTNTIPIGAGK